ncbi:MULTISPECIES: hypothetical protein [Prochlorococcus]|uniref:Uncharacterized protein n=1 Tax=Prochlorococcus marinus (strain SARG / CCMP1375 / SS120) TaxID=167539 RepID=Q7VC32_PROMA|nr:MULTISPECIES: hypothetical protein [Prochlorococcus]AAP99954.1 Predicted protein [Prochlorococcus marinus subsp. marinus str. CCMP1375]KGG11701.1 putative Nucleoside diphosphate kinase [Prochlorococcus marinus str. LG]KGG18885.1 putative Nucleoside diphosphate kinase [Prochlorococcus marinus str. SS2]KGG23577.1 putative Nucleoside diphosphate kinase [Prochlorococcus marinus str. SS35]KGG32187.1 putative Nucleoside diphosphate kinase [Prochlorococcus marinus str. SS51]
MNLSRPSKSRRKGQVFIFRGKSNKSQKRTLAEALIMLIIGVNMMVFLNTLPQGFIASRISSQIWNQLFSSSIELLNALGSIGTAIIVIILMLFSLILIVGGTWRIAIITNRRKLTK